MKQTPPLIMSSLCDPGRVRAENEDCLATRPELGLAVLADGMGGHQAGEVASRMAVDLITEYVAHARIGGRQEPDRRQTLTEAIEKANTAVYQSAQIRPDYKGMGSTVVVAIFSGDRLCIGHVGDSRIYRWRRGALEQMTKDHSVVQELVNRGLFTPEEARQSLSKNLVTRALGVDPTVEAEMMDAVVEPDDIYLLCSDGLTDVVSDEEIANILHREHSDLDIAVKQLIDRANEQGGPDNVSAILVRVSSGTDGN